MRTMLFVVALAIAPGVLAAEAVHKRGDFEFAVDAIPAFVRVDDVPAAWPATAPGANDGQWRYWRYQVQADRRAGRDMMFVEHVYEPRGTSELGEAGRFQINFNPAFQRLQVHRVDVRRGATWHNRLQPERISLARREGEFEKDIADGRVTALIVMDDIRVNDVVRVSYTIIGSNPILAGQWLDGVTLGWRNPVLDSGLRVLLDPGTVPRVHRENTNVEPVVRKAADMVELTAMASGSAPVVFEDDYPRWFRPYPMVQVSAAREWKDVVAWALPLYPAAQPLPSELEERIARWNGMPARADRLREALRAVQDEVRYFGTEIGENSHRPSPPADTWSRRYGDCKDKALLLSTMLARLGIQAAPALLSTERGKAIEAMPASASAFDHVIVRVELDGEVLWLDPTITQQGGDPRSSDLSAYGVALPVLAGTTRLAPILAPKRAVNAVQSVERYIVGDGGKDVQFKVETTYRGAAADHARGTTAAQRRTELSQRYANYYGKRYGALTPVGVPELVDDRAANVLKISESYLLSTPFENEGAAIKALEVYGEALGGVSALPTMMVRRGPLRFGQAASYRHEIDIQYPGQWQPSFKLGDVEQTSKAFVYTRKAQLAERSVRVVHEMEVKQADLAASDAAAHIGDLRQLRDNLSLRLRFYAPTNSDAADRDKRLKALLKGLNEEQKP